MPQPFQPDWSVELQDFLPVKIKIGCKADLVL